MCSTLLNGIDRHFHLIKMFLACLKINVKHSKNLDVETCRLRSVTSQCTKWLFPTTAMCVKTVLSNEPFGYIGYQEKVSAQCHQCLWDAISAVLTFCWHSRCANVMSWHYWTILVWKRPIWIKIGNFLSHVTLKFDGWPWKTIGHLSYATLSFVHHFVVISRFKLELQYGNVQLGSKLKSFCPVWPWNLMDDL